MLIIRLKQGSHGKRTKKLQSVQIWGQMLLYLLKIFIYMQQTLKVVQHTSNSLHEINAQIPPFVWNVRKGSSDILPMFLIMSLDIQIFENCCLRAYHHFPQNDDIKPSFVSSKHTDRQLSSSSGHLTSLCRYIVPRHHSMERPSAVTRNKNVQSDSHESLACSVC